MMNATTTLTQSSLFWNRSNESLLYGYGNMTFPSLVEESSSSTSPIVPIPFDDSKWFLKQLALEQGIQTVSDQHDFDELDNIGILASLTLDLLNSHEDEEVEPVQYFAVRQSIELLAQIQNVLGNNIPLAIVSPSFEGGVRFDWIYPDRSVRLIVPPASSETGYIYYEHGTTFDIETISVHNLVRRLEWINS